MEVKRITIRVPPALHTQLRQVADDQLVSLNTLAVRALEACVEAHEVGQERLPLRELSALLAPAAEASELTEEELLRHAREVRSRIWRERYEQAVQAHSDHPETS
jgi:predicted transcriptional regulator